MRYERTSLLTKKNIQHIFIMEETIKMFSLICLIVSQTPRLEC